MSAITDPKKVVHREASNKLSEFMTEHKSQMNKSIYTLLNNKSQVSSGGEGSPVVRREPSSQMVSLGASRWRNNNNNY